MRNDKIIGNNGIEKMIKLLCKVTKSYKAIKNKDFDVLF